MMTVEEFRSLEEGDLVEMGALLKQLATDEAIVWMVMQVDRVNREVTFEASYCDVYIGCWVCRERDSGLEWEKAD